VDYFIGTVKASPLPSILLAAAGTALAIAPGAWAQDTVVLRNGQVREGKVVGVAGGNIRIQMGASTTGTPLAEVSEVRMEAPPEFNAAAAALADGKAADAVGALQKINDTFSGLPAPWAQRAAALLGDAKLAAGDKEGAAAAYDNLTRVYPGATSLANLGRARLLVESGVFAKAGPLLSPVVAASEKVAFPEPAQAGAVAQAHYLMGRIKEEAGELQQALDHYLKASAVFPYDKNAASSARQRADKLRAEHAGLIAP